jgi:pyrimidine-nucleoside phosphorylase
MSGRGVGHTGGTIDKLESIPGYNVNLTEEEFINQVKKIGIAIIGPTKSLAPADKKMYALRDVTGTVDSIPLIASSIMSKKLAAGTDVIVLDVKVGSGAFMKNVEDATKLAKLMVEIGKSLNKKVIAMLTNMNDPLGYAVGNNLEVIEAINTLNGNGPKDFYDLCINASAELILASGYAKDIDSAINLAKRQIDNKEALNKFAELVKAQYGDESYIYDPSKFAKTPFIIPIISKKSGYVHSIDALTIGNASMKLGAGREKLTDKVNHRVGIILNKKSGDYVNEGDTLAYIHSIKEENDEVINMIIDSYKIDASEYKQELILGVIK